MVWNLVYVFDETYLVNYKHCNIITLVKASFMNRT